MLPQPLEATHEAQYQRFGTVRQAWPCALFPETDMPEFTTETSIRILPTDPEADWYWSVDALSPDEIQVSCIALGHKAGDVESVAFPPAAARQIADAIRSVAFAAEVDAIRMAEDQSDFDDNDDDDFFEETEVA